jgi:cytochrome c oxidase subunit 2
MAALTALALLTLTGCSEHARGEWERGALPVGVTDRSDSVTTFWQWSWVAALIIGAITWFLILFAAIKYRRRSDDEVPVQTRYNLPMEMLYTIAPVVVVLVFFKFVIDTQNDVLAQDDNPDHTVRVVGQQWSWTFNYIEDEALDGQTSVFEGGTPADPPTLYLPVGETVQFDLFAADVIHSFWVPEFLFKLDVIPGQDNSFQVTPTREGTFVGRCAELCGTYHTRMLFDVEVVSPEEYAEQLQRLEDAGNVGIAIGGSEVRKQAGLDSQTGVDDAQTGSNE